MRHFCTAALVLAFALPLCLAQDKGRDQNRDANRQPNQKQMAREEVMEIMLLGQKSVRDELKLDQEESRKISAFTAKQHQTVAEVHKLPDAQQQSRWEELMRQNEQFLQSALKPDQRKRLEQIGMQTCGLLFLTRDTVARDLNLTDAQQQQARQAQEDAHRKFSEIIQSDKAAGRDQQLADLRRSSEEQLNRILSPEQQRKWKELAGTPFRGRLTFDEIEKGKN